MLNVDQTIFHENLLLTQAYCEQQLKRTQKNYAAILRSFNPPVNGKEIFSFELGRYGEDADRTFLFFSKWNVNPLEEESGSLYDELFEQQLQHKREVIGKIEVADVKGQILIVEVDTTIGDGSAEVESGGFIDFYDSLPIDTWFYKITNESQRVFFCWIPEPFINLVNRGIDVNTLECFYWYREEREESNNWHDEHLGEMPAAVINVDDNPPSVFNQLKKLFS